jgi:DNA polymerase III delta subunit
MQIVHGENQVQSRGYFLNLKKSLLDKHLQPIDLDGDALNLADLQNYLNTSSLFGESNAIFIDGFFSRRPSNDKKTISVYLSQQSSAHIYCWEAKDVTTALKEFPPTVIKKFDLPKYIFSFLDNLDVPTYRRCLESMPPEQLLSSIATRLHKVLLGQGRLNLKYTPQKLESMLSSLLMVDYQQKTSNSPVDLASALELWLIEIHNTTIA